MSESATLELQIMRREFAALLANLSPWVSTDEMCARYDCTPKTLNNMERDGRIPFRKRGKWDRVELVNWESKIT